MDWNDIKVFLALVRHGSVRAAAPKLGVSHSTVARRIEVLEKRLGVRLFDRISTGYAITSAGEDVLAIAEGVENDLDKLERRVVGRDQRLVGNIRLTTADFLATHLLMPHLADFMRQYPDINLEVVTTYQALDMNKREADVALRFTKRPPENLVGRPLGTLATAAYASRNYLKKHDLGPGSGACWIGYDGVATFPKWVKETDYPHLPARGNFESLLLQLEAAKAGMGIAMLPCLIGDSDSKLCRVPCATPGPPYNLWLLTHRDVRTTARLRVFTEFLAKAIIGERARLEGHHPR
ncbi:MAG: LysR family transcriptional regulator [Xanthomonadaceae bacterium]|nr:LysR family transcriptional regulator [Xanthomonadaceae bacterium]